MIYNPADFTYGMEIEWGDIRRDIEIPAHLGRWEYAETDICNMHPPYKNVAVDPLGIDPPVGGEINTVPTHSWQEQLDKGSQLYDLFHKYGCKPSASCVNHLHIHVHVPGLIDDIEALKRLMQYIKRNQVYAVTHTYNYKDSKALLACPGAKMYLKHDGGRIMPEWMCDNITNLSTDFNSFIKLHAAGKDGVSMGRPFRYAINTYCLKHINTIEFRHFRGSINAYEIGSVFRYVTQFLTNALNDGADVCDFLPGSDYVFPKMKFSVDGYMGWYNTKYDKSRGKKERHYVDID